MSKFIHLYSRCTIEAFRWDNCTPRPSWLSKRFGNDILVNSNSRLLLCKKNIDISVNIGDYIVLGLNDELFCYQSDIFERTYKEINE